MGLFGSSHKCKVGIVILTDLGTNSDEALGRILNALIMAIDLKKRNKEFVIVFQGAGTRSIAILDQVNHPAYDLYQEVKNNIKGASHACSVLFKADVKDITPLKEFDISNVGMVTSLSQLCEDEYCLITF